MRGSSFYKENRLAVRDLDKDYIRHRDMLNKIKQRHKSYMCKFVLKDAYTYLKPVVDAQGVKTIEVRGRSEILVKPIEKISNVFRSSYQD